MSSVCEIVSTPLMHNEMFVVFGGYAYGYEGSTDSPQSTIAQYNPNTDTWTKLGDLINARNGHDIITTEGVCFNRWLGSDREVPV